MMREAAVVMATRHSYYFWVLSSGCHISNRWSKLFFLYTIFADTMARFSEELFNFLLIYCVSALIQMQSTRVYSEHAADLMRLLKMSSRHPQKTHLMIYMWAEKSQIYKSSKTLKISELIYSRRPIAWNTPFQKKRQISLLISRVSWDTFLH